MSWFDDDDRTRAIAAAPSRRRRRGIGTTPRAARGRGRRRRETSLPPHLTGLPSTSTASTLPAWPPITSAPIGSIAGARLSASRRISMRSARLPALIEPIRSSRPSARAPPRVANSSTSRAVIIGRGGPLAIAPLRTARSMPSAARISVNMSPLAVISLSTLETRSYPLRQHPSGRRQPEAARQHRHEGGDRRRGAGVGKEPELVVARGAAVQAGEVGAEQVVVMHLLDRAVAGARLAHADMHGDADAELARECHVVRDHLHGGEFRPARRQRERDQRVVGGQLLLADAADVGQVGQGAVEHPGFRVVTGLAVAENGAAAGVAQRPHVLIGMGGRVLDVRPVEQRGDAGVERRQAPEQGRRVDVLGPEARAELAEQLDEHVRQVPIDAGMAQRRLPQVAMRLDEPGQHEKIARIHGLAAVGRDCAAHGGDASIVDEHVAGEFAKARLERHEEAAAQEYAFALRGGLHVHRRLHSSLTSPGMPWPDDRR